MKNKIEEPKTLKQLTVAIQNDLLKSTNKNIKEVSQLGKLLKEYYDNVEKCRKSAHKLQKHILHLNLLEQKEELIFPLPKP